MTDLTPEQASATERFLTAFGIARDLAREVTRIRPDEPVYVTASHYTDALFCAYAYDPIADPWRVAATDRHGHFYSLDLRTLELAVEDAE